MINRRTFLVTSALLSKAAWSQVRPGFDTLNENIARLQSSVVVDKELYLLGEEMRVTLTVTNPTNRSLIVYQPYVPVAGVVTLVPLDDSGDMIPGKSTVSEFALTETDYLRWPIETLAAGQVRTQSFSSSDRTIPLNRIVLPASPGRYGIYYSYQGALARFRFVRPVLEQIDEARFPVDLFIPGDDLGTPAETVALFRYAFALRHDSVSYICALRGRTDSFRRQGQPDYYGPLEPLVANSLKPYKIVGTSASPVTSLVATMDNAENFTILYATSPGGPQTRIDVDTNLNPR